MIDPKDLLVFIVGIERYAGGRTWNLKGPVRDALDFAEWLVERGLPPENIQAFLSPLEDGDPLASRPALRKGMVVRGGKTTDIYPALDGDLRHKKPRHFCLFWGGHGCVKDDNRRYLLGSEATDDNVQCIDLTGFLNFLKTDAVGAARQDNSPDFIAIVDACASFVYSQGLDRRITSQNFPMSNPTRRSQCALFATDTGERARNLETAGTGLFSRELRDHMQGMKRLEDLFELETIALKLRSRFTQLQTQGLSNQTPTFYSVKPFFNDEQTLGSPGIDPVDARFPSHAVTAREFADLCDLIVRLNPQIPESVCRRLYPFATELRTPAPESSGDYACFRDCALQLARMCPGPIFTFLELIRPSISDLRARQSVLDWEHRVANRLRIDITPFHARARVHTDLRPYQIVQLVIDPVFGFEPGNERYRIHAAVSSSEDQPGTANAAGIETVCVSETIATAQLRDSVHAVFRQALRSVVSMEALRVEAVLPAELLPSGAQDWRSRWGRSEIQLNSRYALALRSYERGYDENYQGPRLLQRDKWRRLQNGLANGHIAWHESITDLDEQAFEHWDSDGTLAFCALTFAGTDRNQLANAVERLISAGIPVGLWFCHPQQPADGWRQILRDRFISHPSSEWPPQALQFQKHPALPCKGLALLWDDPEHPLAKLPGREWTPLQAPLPGPRS